MKKNGKAAIVTAAVLLVVGAGGFFMVQNGNAAQKEEAPVNQREYQVVKGDITVGIDGVGKVEVPQTKYTMPKDIGVAEVLVQEGDWVQEGQTLFVLSGQESEKYRDLLDAQRQALEEKLENLQGDRIDFVDSMTWKLENDQERSANRYYNGRWEIKNRIENLEYALADAQWKRDYVSDDALTQSTVAQLEEELAQKRQELESFESSRETEQAQEEDPAHQATLSQAKLKEWDDKIAACKTELEAQYMQIEQAKTPRITAKNQGVVSKVSATPGEATTVEIGEKEDMVIRLTIEPEDIVDVAEGQQVEFSLDAYPDQILQGTVDKRILTPDSNGKFAALIAPKQEITAETELLPGMGASGILVVKQKKDIITLPNKAITLKDGKQYIQVRVADGTLEEREIQTGFSDGKLTEITAGAKAGDTAITKVSL